MRSSTSSDAIKNAIRAKALEEGFDAAGFAQARAPEGAAEGLSEYLERGLHGDMEWMAATAERRADPKKLWEGARSVIALGLNYAPDSDPMAALARRDTGTISVYAQNEDYHEVVKKKL